MEQITESEKIKDENRRKYYAMMPHVMRRLIKKGLISDADFKIYYFIRSICGEDGGLCYMSSKNICNEIHVGKATLSRSKRKLEKLGLITIEEVESGNLEPCHVMQTVDIWDENLEYIAEIRKKDTVSNSKKNEKDSYGSLVINDELHNIPSARSATEPGEFHERTTSCSTTEPRPVPPENRKKNSFKNKCCTEQQSVVDNKIEEREEPTVKPTTRKPKYNKNLADTLIGIVNEEYDNKHGRTYCNNGGSEQDRINVCNAFSKKCNNVEEFRKCVVYSCNNWESSPIFSYARAKRGTKTLNITDLYWNIDQVYDISVGEKISEHSKAERLQQYAYSG